jgi:gamma-glutamylcyclotransferase (GGCT)/AIG2-like uncharacterized protein YtfP
VVQPVQPEFIPGAPTIIGEVFRIRHNAISAILDAYEGYDAGEPERGLFNRCIVPSQSGKDVWIYTYNAQVRAEQAIPGGDWCKASIIMPKMSFGR